MNKESVQSVPSYGIGYLAPNNTYDRLFGKLCTQIEALGLPEKQEESLKSLIRGIINEVSENWIVIDSDLNDLIMHKAWSNTAAIGSTLGRSNKIVKLVDIK